MTLYDPAPRPEGGGPAALAAPMLLLLLAGVGLTADTGAAAGPAAGVATAVAGSVGFGGASLLAVFLAATLSSIVGFAFSPICGALLFHMVDDPLRVVQTMVLCTVGMQGVAVWSLRRELAMEEVWPMLLGGLAALPFGVWLLRRLDGATYVTVVGVVILAYGAWMLLRPPLRLARRPGRWADGLVGAVGGLTGGLMGFPGGAAVIWCGLHGWPRRRQRGVYQPYILVMQVAALGALSLAMASRAGGPVWRDSTALAHVAPALLGTVCGLGVFRRLSERQFGIAVNLLLIVSGLGLVF